MYCETIIRHLFFQTLIAWNGGRHIRKQQLDSGSIKWLGTSVIPNIKKTGSYRKFKEPKIVGPYFDYSGLAKQEKRRSFPSDTSLPAVTVSLVKFCQAWQIKSRSNGVLRGRKLTQQTVEKAPLQ